MAKLGINTGSAPDDGNGDSLLVGALKINSNFTEIYNVLGDGTHIHNSIGYALTSGISTVSQGLTGTPNINVNTLGASVVNVTGSGTSTSQLRVTGVSTLSTTNISGDLTFTGSNDLYLKDNGVANFGNSNDLQIYHNGSASVIRDAGTGGLQIDSDNEITLAKSTGENMLVATTDGPVSLYYDNAKKFETLGTGVTVTGITFTNQLNVSGFSTSVYLNVPGGAYFNPTNSQLYYQGNLKFQTLDTGNEVVGSQKITGAGLGLNIGGIPRNGIQFASSVYDQADFYHSESGLLSINNYFFDGGQIKISLNAPAAGSVSEIVRIKHNAIGIGTTNPTSALTVNGNISASAGVLAGFSTFTAIRVANDAGNNTAQYVTNIGPNYVIGFNTGGGYPEDKYFQFSSGNPNFILENVGIGTTNATSKLTVRGGDISVGVSTAHGVILTSPNGTQYRLIVDNSGNLSTVAV